jgi:RNA polymerase sigma-70 factor (ECF subfamily)
LGDADVLFAAHERGVFRYLCRVVGERDAARDLTQEVFLRVARAGTVPGGSSAPPRPAPAGTADVEAVARAEAGRRAWVFRIARNLALNHIRDRGRRPEIGAVVDVNLPATQELKLALDRAVATLVDVDRDVFLLRESAGLSYAEIAAACDLTEDGVRARLHRARQQLRAELGATLAARQRAGAIRLMRAEPDGISEHDD